MTTEPFTTSRASCACGLVHLGGEYLAVTDEDQGVTHAAAACLVLGLGADGLPVGLPPEARP